MILCSKQKTKRKDEKEAAQFITSQGMAADNIFTIERQFSINLLG